jgi:hypothetical protein
VTVVGWLAKHAAFAASYRHARQVQADVWADEIVDLAKSEPLLSANGAEPVRA